MYNENNKIINNLSRGYVCGEYGSILFKQRKSKLICATWSEFYSINIDDIKHILEIYYPKTCELKWKRIKKYMKYAYKNNINHTVEINSCNTLINDENNPFNMSQQSLSSAHSTTIHLFSQYTHKQKQKQKHNQIQKQKPQSDTEYDDSIEEKKNHIKSTQLACAPPTETQLTFGRKTDSKSLPNSTINTVRNFAKFGIRSDSDLRNVVVVAHTEKHNELDIPSLIPKLSKAQKYIKYSTINYDSECSFSSFSTDSTFDGNEINKYNYNYKNNNNNRKINKKKRKKKKGFVGLKPILNNNQSITVYKRDISKNMNRTPSCDSTILLAPLSGKENNITPIKRQKVHSSTSNQMEYEYSVPPPPEFSFPLTDNNNNDNNNNDNNNNDN
eukprot:72122_1